MISRDETLESSKELKSADYHEIALDLNSYITTLKRLAEYENMEPVAWGVFANDVGYAEFTNDSCLAERWRNAYELSPGLYDDLLPLYRHPRK
ncbi:hypothetical protein IQ209_15515 [Xenorhabdus sp. BG5]|nr:hypothetical protein [Xenorhabdus sp. BG5]